MTKPSRSGVERPAGARGIVVSAREGAHRGEARDRERRDPRLAAAAEHDVGAAEPDRVVSLADRHRGRRARRARRTDRAARPELHRHPAGRHVRHERGHEARVDARGVGAGAARGKARDAALRGRDRRADAVGLPGDVEAGVRLRHPRRSDRKLGEAVGAVDPLLVEPLPGLELVRLAGDPHGVAVGRESRHRSAAALAGHAAGSTSSRRPSRAASPRRDRSRRRGAPPEATPALPCTVAAGTWRHH